MSSELLSKTKKPKSKLIWLIGVIAIAVAASFYAAMQGGVDKALVKTQLDAWISYVAADDSNIEITYDDIEMIGAGTDRHAVIRDLKVIFNSPIVSEEEVLETKNEPLSTIVYPEIELHVDDITFDKFTVRISKPIEMSDIEGNEVTVSTEKPINASFELESKDGHRLINFDNQLAAVWHVESRKAEEDTKKFRIEIAENSGSHGYYYEQVELGGNIISQIEGMKIYSEKDGDDAQKAIAMLSSAEMKVTWRDFDKPQAAVSVLYELNDIASETEEMPYGALSFNMDVDYSGPSMMDGKGLKTIDWSVEKSLLELRELSMKTDDVEIGANISLQTGLGEPLPIGDGELNIKGFDFILNELRKSGKFAEDQEKLVSTMVQAITGEELEGVKDIKAELKRESGQSFHIGNASFEELFTIFLTGGAMPMPAAEPAVEESPQPESGHNHTHGAVPVEELEVQEIEELFNEK